MSGEPPEPEFVEARPMSKRALLVTSVVAFLLVALLVLTAERAHQRFAVLGVIVPLAAVLLGGYARTRIRADAAGLTSRGPIRTQAIAWNEIEDFYLRPPNHAHIRSAKRPIAWDRKWHGSDALMRFVEQHATRAPCRSFEPLGVRDCDLPRDIREPRDLRIAAALVVLSGLWLSLSMVRPAVGVLMNLDRSEGTAVAVVRIALLILALLVSLPVLIGGVVMFVRAGRTPRMHVHATVQGMEVELDGKRARIRWDEVIELRRSPATRGWLPDVVVRTAKTTLALPDYVPTGLFDLASRRVPAAAVAAANEDPVLGEDLLPAVEGDGFLEVSYRTRLNRVLLFAIAALQLFPGMVLFERIGLVDPWPTPPSLTGPVAAALILAALYLLALAAYLRIRIRIDASGLHYRGLFRRRSIASPDLRGLRPTDGPTLRVEAHPKDLVLWSLVTGGPKLANRIAAQTRAP